MGTSTSQPSTSTSTKYPISACRSINVLDPRNNSHAIKSNQIKIYIAPYVHEDSEALGGWITCSRCVGIDEFLNVFLKDSKLLTSTTSAGRLFQVEAQKNNKAMTVGCKIRMLNYGCPIGMGKRAVALPWRKVFCVARNDRFIAYGNHDADAVVAYC